MPASLPDISRATLDLPETFEDLGGLLEVDLRAIVRMLSERALDLGLLEPQDARHFQGDLWTRLSDALLESLDELEPSRT